MFLSEILDVFDSQLSQEQTWAVCYMSTKSLAAQRRDNLLKRKHIRYIISIESLQINPTGQVSMISDEDTTNRQKESEVIKSLGNMLCRCLDYGLDVSHIDSINFEPEMAELIAGMVLQQFDEQDEGYGDDPVGNFSRKTQSRSLRCFRSFDEICRFCEARLERKNIASGAEHYRNVLKALYVESHELKMFLDHVTPSVELASEDGSHRLNPGAASTAQECVYQWARFWLQVMHELRRGVHLRKVAQTKVSPLEYEFTPFEIASDKTVSSSVDLKPNRQSGLPDNAGEIILDFILSRPSDIRKANNDEIKEYHSNEIEQLSFDNDAEFENSHLSNKRKQLKVQTPLLSRIENWDASQDSLLSDDIDRIEASLDCCTEGYGATKNSLYNGNNNLGSRRNSAENPDPNDHRKRLRRRRSAELSFDDIKLSPRDDDTDSSGFSELSSAKKRLAVSTMCLTDISLDEDPRVVGTSLFEMSKIRQAIALAETELLAAKTAKNLDIRYGRVCFACQKTKFSIFKSAKQCEICRKKFCAKCTILNVEVPDHLVDTSSKTNCQKYETLGSSTGLSKSLGNLTAVGTNDSITPFPCKRQSILQVGHKTAFGGKLVNLCKECKTFMDSIVIETKNTRWHVGMTMEI